MSSKTSTQPGRRTPLSLSGAVTKSNPNKSGHNAANGSGGNTNGHSTSNSNKQDNKLQQKNDQVIANNSDVKESANKKQQPPTDKRQQQNDTKKSNEKPLNGVSSNKQQQSNEQKQQHQNKEKMQHQNGNDNNNKLNEKDKKERSEKCDKSDKTQQKSEKEDANFDENKKDKPENKKEEITKEAKDGKEEQTSESDSKTEKQQPIKEDDKKSKEEDQIKKAHKKQEEKIENMEVVEEQLTPQKSIPTAITPKSNTKPSKITAIVNKTPTKNYERTPQKSTPTIAGKTKPVTKREETTAVDDSDIEMEPLSIENSPIKSSQKEEVANIKISPSATSTPGKILLPKHYSGAQKSDVQLAMQTGHSPDRPRTFSQISGRKSIRPISDYTPSKFQSNLQFRESYRRINTELDVTNTSINVTVGSEAPNNSSFFFFGRGRKRDRPHQHSQSAIGELQTDVEISPPKRARLDMYGIFSVVSSPLSLLRNRFSKASLQSSTPVKLQQKLNTPEDDIEVQNVSGVSVHEEVDKCDKEPTETNAAVVDDNDATLGEEVKETKFKADITPTGADSECEKLKDDSCEKMCAMEETYEQSDIKITETPLHSAVADPMAKNKRCIVM